MKLAELCRRMEHAQGEPAFVLLATEEYLSARMVLDDADNATLMRFLKLADEALLECVDPTVRMNILQCTSRVGANLVTTIHVRLMQGGKL